jgi:hypothetical protein
LAWIEWALAFAAFGSNRGFIGDTAIAPPSYITAPGHSIGSPTGMTTATFRKTSTPHWLLAFWKEIDDKTFGKGFDCFTENAICNLGVADWHGREEIRRNLRAFIDTGFTAHHDVVEYWDGGPLKVFRGIVTMTPADESKSLVRPTMTHFFYMDEADPTKVSHWYGAVGPVEFG